jgi:hypothetical protein
MAGRSSTARRACPHAQTLPDLVRRVEAGEPEDGAKPKALLEIDGAQWVLKFAEHGEPASTDARRTRCACKTATRWLRAAVEP